jgi:hypothetical protein
MRRLILQTGVSIDGFVAALDRSHPRAPRGRMKAPSSGFSAPREGVFLRSRDLAEVVTPERFLPVGRNTRTYQLLSGGSDRVSHPEHGSGSSLA